MLSPEQISEFKANGCLIIPDVLTDVEVDEARHNFHMQLKSIGIDHHRILAKEVDYCEGPRIKSSVARIYYSKWKLIDVMLHPKVCSTFDAIMQATYRTNEIPHFMHPYGRSENNLLFIDRVCWRLPDSVRAEGGLGLHLDQNPFDPYSNTVVFRPIQGFISLTDQYSSTSGGIRVVKKFHKEIEDYFQKGIDEKSTGGAFHRMNSKVHAKLVKRCEPMFAPKGSLVIWDYRLPHQTSDFLSGNDTREVVYCSFLPDVPLNKIYIAEQLRAVRNNIPPPIYRDANSSIHSDRDWDEQQLPEWQKRYLGII